MNRLAQLRKDYLENKEPKKFKELKATGELNRHCNQQAEEAESVKAQLMNQSGLRDYEAEEIIRDMLTH